MVKKGFFLQTNDKSPQSTDVESLRSTVSLMGFDTFC